MKLIDDIQSWRRERAINKIMDNLDNTVLDRMNEIINEKRLDITPTIITQGSGKNGIVAKLKKFLGKMLTSNRASWSENSGYDLARMVRAYETEMFLARVVDQYVISVLQRGFDFVGNNPETVNYITKRFFEMQIVSKISLTQIISAQVMQLLLFGNSFITKHRSLNSSSGKYWTRFDGADFTPIAAIEAQDAVSMRIRLDNKKSVPSLYYQLKRSEYGNDGRQIRMGFGIRGPKRNNEYVIEWKPDDIVHIKFHPLPGKLWAMPPFQPVLNDILVLREIEESIELLVYQYGHIFLHGKVEMPDTDQKQQEIDHVKHLLEQMEGNGAIVTGSETTFSAIGAEGKAVRAEGYLAYFQQRVLAGLFTSGISMGQGSSANRNTSDFIDKQKQEVTKELQNIITEAMQEILDELLFEAGKDVDYVWKNRVHLYFPDPDIENKIKIEQHASLLYSSNCLTESEMREMIGKKALTEKDRNELYYRKVTLTEADERSTIDLNKEIKFGKVTHQQNKEIARIGARVKASSSVANKSSSSSAKNSKGNSKTNKGEGAKKSATQSTRPSNQYGTKSGPGSTKN
jgi:hypothetical protein